MKNEKNRKLFRFIKGHRVRLSLFGVLILSLFVAPALTQAQYKWTLNGYSILQAKEFYFDGNYLHDSATKAFYQTTGWDGKALALDKIELRNFENALLANKKGEDLYYDLTWSIQTFNEKGKEITGDAACTLEYNSSTSAEENAIARKKDENNHDYISSHINGNGNPKKDTYSFTIQPGSKPLQADEYVVITFSAKNYGTADGSENSFQRTLGCQFKYIVSTAETFVKSFDPVDQAESKNVKLKIGSGTMPDISAAAQTIVVWWDTDAMEVNAFNAAFSEAASVDGNYKTFTSGGRNFGQVRLTGLGSNSYRELAFYKKDYKNNSSTDHWFTDDFISKTVARNTKPDAAGTDVILGYYVEDKSGSGN